MCSKYFVPTHINEDCIDVVCAVVPLEGGDVWTEVVRCKLIQLSNIQDCKKKGTERTKKLSVVFVRC